MLEFSNLYVRLSLFLPLSFSPGNIGVLKSFLTEISDDSNRGKAFASLSLAWAMGSFSIFYWLFHSCLSILYLFSLFVSPFHVHKHVYHHAGTIAAPLVGGLLSKPVEKYAIFKSSHVLASYPYLLPCLLCVMCNLCMFMFFSYSLFYL